MVLATRYKIKPLVLFSTGNVKDDTTKVIKHAKAKEYQLLTDIIKQLKTTVFVSFCQVEKDIKMKVNNNEQRGINTSNDKGIFKN